MSQDGHITNDVELQLAPAQPSSIDTSTLKGRRGKGMVKHPNAYNLPERLRLKENQVRVVKGSQIVENDCEQSQRIVGEKKSSGTI